MGVITLTWWWVLSQEVIGDILKQWDDEMKGAFPMLRKSPHQP